MIEMQPKVRYRYQPPRERLAVLLAQLSELDPDSSRKLKLEPMPSKEPAKVPAKVPAKTQAKASETILKIEPAPNKKLKLEPNSEPGKKPRLKPLQSPKRKKKVNPERTSKAVNAKKSEPASTSFQAILRSCLKKQAVDLPKQHAESARSPWLGLGSQGPLGGGIARICSWVQSKYAKSATKRLRLSEVVSLGDKRFVALVRVEDREFLIGGAASGLSVLAQLGETSNSANGQKLGMDVEGHAR